MTTQTAAKHTGPLRCRNCGNTTGPLTLDGLCEDCEQPGAGR